MAEGVSTADLDTQKKKISTLSKTSLVKGDTWYLIDTKWYKQWKKYVGFDSWDISVQGDETANPGPIDNQPLFKEGETNVLKEHLLEELDYMLLPEQAWKALVKWYGTIEAQEPIGRKVIEHGMYVKQCKVEVYLMDLNLCNNSEIDNVVTCQFSRAETLDNIEKKMRKLFNVTENKEVRLWNKYMSNTYEQLSKLDNTVQDAGLYQGQVIVIEPQNDDGTWPRQSKNSNSSVSTYTESATNNRNSGSYETNYSSSPAKNAYSMSGGSFSSSGSSYYNSYDNYTYKHTAPGLCGLSNLGNTCFMNSALQCMSNVPGLTEYFHQQIWKKELNLDNPLGMKGEIATSYAELIQGMWSGKYSYTMPRQFKIAVGRFAPQFSGYQQQDSQELMAFLLDGLHEDLNRIRKKPYVETKDADNRPDAEVAEEAWVNYLKRNDSVIVDMFHGLLKSTLVCPECSKISVTFDPFCYLSLPLPIKKERYIEVALMPHDPKKLPKRYKLTVPKMGQVLDLCQALSKLTKIPPKQLVVTDVYNHRFHKIFTMEDGLSHILDRDDIFVYEVPPNAVEDNDVINLLVYMREKKIRVTYSNHHQVTSQLFGQPMVLSLTRDSLTYDELYKMLLQRMSRYVKQVTESDEEWWKPTENSHNDMETNGDQQMENNSSDEDDGMGEEDNPENGTPRMFKIEVVNSYGTSEVQKIKDDDKPIKFCNNNTYLALDWNMKAKEKFYDEKAAEDYETDESAQMKPAQKKQIIQLDDCLKLFTTRERLGENDAWYCPKCKKHQLATKKFDLWSLPQVLVIHLKRFSYNRYWRDKLDVFVEYPTRGLNMKNFLINPKCGTPVYDLIAVSNHYGGLGGGHYTAYAKNKEDNQWYNFDDSCVSTCTEDSVVTKNGYVLVYQRRNPRAYDPPLTSPRHMSISSDNSFDGDSNSNNGGYASADEGMETN